jgi:HEAT repeat protein
MERLEDDHEREVRVAAAWALGEIGDARAMLALDRASLYDRREDVRDAAAQAITRLKSHETVVENAQPADAPIQSSPSTGVSDMPEPLPLGGLDDTPPPPPQPEPPPSF